jgi:hypothetical protein
MRRTRIMRVSPEFCNYVEHMKKKNGVTGTQFTRMIALAPPEVDKKKKNQQFPFSV